MIRSPVTILAILPSISLAWVVLAAPASAQDAKAAPVFEDGQAQVVPAFRSPRSWISHHLWVETEFDSDGDGKPDRVHVDVTRPGQTDSEGLKVPVIYETSPYFAGIAGNNAKWFWDPSHEIGATPPAHVHPPEIRFQDGMTRISGSQVRQWVPRGFAVVHSCSPGTGRSDGCPTIGGKNESLAPKAVIDWLNGRARGFTTPDGDEAVEAYWSTGKVGMTGTSYNGTLPLAAATTGVEGLEAIVPIAPNTSYYHYYRANGLVRHPGGYMGEDIDVLFDFVYSGDPEKREYCRCEVRDKLFADNQDRVTGDYNEFWASRDYANQLDKVRAACLMVHGFNDWNVMPSHTVRIYEALKQRGVPAMAFFHQGGHGGGPTAELMNKWFTRYLYGVDNGVEDLPRAWVVREGDRPNRPTSYADYPNPEARPVKVFPSGDGSKVGSLLAIKGSGEQRLVDDVSQAGAALAMAESSPSRLLFATPELTEPLHLSGTPTLRIRVASSKPACNLSVWLVSLPWTEGGAPLDNIVTRGWADPQNHASLTESEPLQPGSFYDVEFELEPDDQILPAGAKLGLMIFSSDRDFTLWPEPGTELAVDLAETTLTLPVVGGAGAWAEAIGR